MPLNKVNKDSDMYQWIDSTLNMIKGICPHGCTYCKTKEINYYAPKLDDKEFKTNLIGNIKIFLGTSIDMFAESIPDEWILKVFEHLKYYPLNTYIFQTKNPAKMLRLKRYMPKNSIIGITLESNLEYPAIYNKAPSIKDRHAAFTEKGLINFITIEPIMRFTLNGFIKIITDIKPQFINIGANTNSKVFLPEPTKGEIDRLYIELSRLGYEVKLKSNLERIKQ